jgi:hypothetical protein
MLKCVARVGLAFVAPFPWGWGWGFAGFGGVFFDVILEGDHGHGADAGVREETFEGVEGVEGAEKGDEGAESGTFAVFDGGDRAAGEAAAFGDLLLAEIQVKAAVFEARAEFLFDLRVGTDA